MFEIKVNGQRDDQWTLGYYISSSKPLAKGTEKRLNNRGMAVQHTENSTTTKMLILMQADMGQTFFRCFIPTF